MIELTEERRDALAEILNIGFGRSIASLADMLGIYIRISVPSIRVVDSNETADILSSAGGGETEVTLIQQSFRGEFTSQDEVTLIQQSFRGEFNGEGVLAIPGAGGHTLSRMLEKDCGFKPTLEPDKLHLEVLLELGNVVLGACLGKFAELLESILSFSPPQIFQDTVQLERLQQAVSFPDYRALTILTSFSLENEEVDGYMFIFISTDFLDNLFTAVDRFLDGLT